GDITAVGNITSGDAFTSGAPGSELYFASTGWLGLGSGDGRIQFTSDTTDEISFLSANVGIGRTNPAYTLDINGTLRVGDSAIFMAVGATTDTNHVLTLDGSGKLSYIYSSAWDKLASDDLTTSTQFTGDVSGLYNNLQIQSTAVGANELASTS